MDDGLLALKEVDRVLDVGYLDDALLVAGLVFNHPLLALQLADGGAGSFRDGRLGLLDGFGRRLLDRLLLVDGSTSALLEAGTDAIDAQFVDLVQERGGDVAGVFDSGRRRRRRRRGGCDGRGSHV